MSLRASVKMLLELHREIRAAGSHAGGTSAESPPVCTADGAPPMPTSDPVTIEPYAEDGRVLRFDQRGVMRYACLNLPAGAAVTTGRRWPLVIYLHGSRVTPDSIYTFGKTLFTMRNSFPLAGSGQTPGFILLSPGGRRASPPGAPTGTGFHWDEWYRNPTDNLDALAIDHFLDEVIATGLVDTKRIYVFGWSNGAYMAALYGVWRSARIAAIGQYAGADPWAREPCPVPLTFDRKVPLVLLRNLCDQLVPCSATSAWISTLREQDWPFVHHNLGLCGNVVGAGRSCAGHCSKWRGLYEHVRFPGATALTLMLEFMQQHPLA